MIDSSTLEKKIQYEKRKRSQIYHSLDYYLTNLSFFDFFSNDTFFFSKLIKVLIKELPKNEITSEIFLFAFLNSKNQILSLLKNFQLEERLLFELSKKNFHFFNSSNFFFNFLQKKKKKRKNLFSFEIQNIFEKTTENALKRFKTPIISLEILFFTLMETKESKAYQILKKSFKNETEWFLFRYQLLKKIHKEESTIREEVSVNQQYFAYLLKAQITSNQFENVIDNENLPQTVALFRNTLIVNVLQNSFFDEFSKDIFSTMDLTRNRLYST